MINMVGRRYGQLVVLEFDSRRGLSNTLYWRCKCDCGNVVVTRGQRLRDGKVKSCGQRISERTTEYTTWCGMRNRCLNSESRDYKWYGGRGITVCEEWQNDYWQFLKDMGRKPDPYLSLERIDNEKGYEPRNCIWADVTKQANNRRPAGRNKK